MQPAAVRENTGLAIVGMDQALARVSSWDSEGQFASAVKALAGKAVYQCSEGLASGGSVPAHLSL